MRQPEARFIVGFKPLHHDAQCRQGLKRGVDHRDAGADRGFSCLVLYSVFFCFHTRSFRGHFQGSEDTRIACNSFL